MYKVVFTAPFADYTILPMKFAAGDSVEIEDFAVVQRMISSGAQVEVFHEEKKERKTKNAKKTED